MGPSSSFWGPSVLIEIGYAGPPLIPNWVTGDPSLRGLALSRELFDCGVSGLAVGNSKFSHRLPGVKPHG